MAYYVGDIPAEDIVIEPARQGEPIDLSPFDDTDTVLRDFDGNIVETSGFLATIGGNEVTVDWPGETVFDTAGLYSLTVILLNAATGVRERLAPVYLIAQDDDGWHTLDSARAPDAWPDAPSDDNALFTLLEMAKEQVIIAAPALAEGAHIPLNYKGGQLMQARNIWNSSKKDSGTGDIGDGAFAITPHPLDWMIEQILRPKRGVMAVG